MKSRARMLLEKEYVKLQKEPIWGVLARPLNDDDLFVWEAKINGLKDTMWEGGVFKIYLKFNEKYNYAPPQLFFTTIPFHPNVDILTGRPCVDFLDNLDEWKQCYCIGFILLTLQALLVNPVLENAVNREAASVYMNSPEVYRQVVLNCVLASKRLDGELSLHASDHSPNIPAVQTTHEPDKTPGKGSPRVTKISFEDYLSLWKGIATSNPSEMSCNPLNDFLKFDSKLQKAHFELSKEELEHEIRVQLAEHKRLMYGKFYKEVSANDKAVDNRLNRIQLLQYVRSPEPASQVTPADQSSLLVDDTEDFVKEADDLVSWTRSLTPEQVNF